VATRIRDYAQNFHTNEKGASGRKSEYYEPYKYWDPFVERGNPPDEDAEKESDKRKV